MFQGLCSSTLIGSFPLNSHEEALELIFNYSPEIPLWPQLPLLKTENMIVQFLPGMPGFKGDIVLTSENLDEEVLEFYQEYLDIKDGKKNLKNSRFSLKEEARGFNLFVKKISDVKSTFRALKGQVTGPFTFCVSVKDQEKRSILYDFQLKDVAVKLIGLKARFQVEVLSQFSLPVIIFFDEPALAGFGSSEFISVARDEVISMLKEVFQEVKKAGGISGIHVCANTDWSLVVDSGPDILNFDSYGFFDRFVLFADSIRKFLSDGGTIAWGVIPTFESSKIKNETVNSLVERFFNCVEEVERRTGISKKYILTRSLITPSCGLGSLTFDNMMKVLELLVGVTRKIKEKINYD